MPMLLSRWNPVALRGETGKGKGEWVGWSLEGDRRSMEGE